MRTDSITDYDRRIDGCEHAACFDDHALAETLERLVSSQALSMQILSGSVLGELVEAAGRLPFRPAESEVGKPEARVYQEFGYCGDVPPHHFVSRIGDWFEMRLRRSLALMPSPPIPTDYTINDVVCQRYRPGDLGITPHRDHIAYTHLVTLLVLSGRGRYCVCDDRQGSGKREIPSGPGWAILMPGPGFAGRTDRPFHMVEGISTLRYSVGLRHDSRKVHAD